MSTTSKKYQSLVQRLSRRLRYRPVDDIVGKLVTINSIESIKPDTLGFVHRFFSGCEYAGPSQSDVLGGLAHYGHADLKFTLEYDLRGPDVQSGLELLKNLGFIYDDDATESEKQDYLDCLELLNEGIDKNETVLEIFLKPASNDVRSDWEQTMKREFDDAFREMNQHISIVGWTEAFSGMQNRLDKILRDPWWIRFPVELEVVDACLTNSGYVWFHKHFYF